MKSKHVLYLCVLYGRAKSSGITGEGTPLTTFWMGHNSAILATKVHLAKLRSSPTWHTEFRLDHLSSRRNTVNE